MRLNAIFFLLLTSVCTEQIEVHSKPRNNDLNSIAIRGQQRRRRFAVATALTIGSGIVAGCEAVSTVLGAFETVKSFWESNFSESPSESSDDKLLNKYMDMERKLAGINDELEAMSKNGRERNKLLREQTKLQTILAQREYQQFIKLEENTEQRHEEEMQILRNIARNIKGVGLRIRDQTFEDNYGEIHNAVTITYLESYEILPSSSNVENAIPVSDVELAENIKDLRDTLSYDIKNGHFDFETFLNLAAYWIRRYQNRNEDFSSLQYDGLAYATFYAVIEPLLKKHPRGNHYLRTSRTFYKHFLNFAIKKSKVKINDGQCRNFYGVVNCPAGFITTTTTAPTTTAPVQDFDTILILNTGESTNVPLLYTIGGEVNSEINFEFGEGTGSENSCSAVLEGKMMIFGGPSSSRYDYGDQISQVIGCRLERVGQFPGSVNAPACNTFGSSPNQRVWICFNKENFSECKSYDGSSIVDEQDANYEHITNSNVLGKYEDSPFVVGGESNVKVEHYKTSWSTLGDFPYAKSYIDGYSTVTIDGEVYIFGGYGGGYDLAAKYNGSWSQVGALLQARYCHRSIAQGNTVIHIGGYGEQYFEEWKIDGDNIEKKQSEATINNYVWSSFWVPADFCV